MATRKTANEVHADVAIHPGEHLAEILEERELTQTGLAKRMKRPVQVIGEIVRGGKGITAETALQLEGVLGISAEFWMNLESNYRLTKARLAMKRRRPKRATSEPGAR